MITIISLTSITTCRNIRLFSILHDEMGNTPKAVLLNTEIWRFLKEKYKICDYLS